MKIQNMFCFWSQVFFQLVKFTIEKWPIPPQPPRYLKQGLPVLDTHTKNSILRVSVLNKIQFYIVLTFSIKYKSIFY